MPLDNAGEIVNGLEDIKVQTFVAGAPSATKVDLGGAQTISFNVESDSAQVRGDNQVLANVRGAKSLTGSITVARIYLPGFAAMVGGTASTTGVSPDQITTLDETSSPGSTAFQATAQAYSYDLPGSGYRVTLKKLTVTGGPNETMGDQEFDTPTIDFEGAPVSNVLLTRANYETFTEYV